MRISTLVTAALLSLSASYAMADHLDSVLGGAIGGAAGAAIGQSVGGRDGAIIGSAIGGATGVILTQQRERVIVRQPRPQPVVYAVPVQPRPVYYVVQPDRHFKHFRKHGHWDNRGGWGDRGRWGEDD
ncbi:glycine zipper domain-containing protein [Vogesella oryzae]|uniref:glycine zipper domain-containing protein n=1 Tax=Vogesella oryzae TaxID=1735285 RepID=UPI0015824E48|nr:glycine zipper domain-containing protein [Vogesella oryzae]